MPVPLCEVLEMVKHGPYAVLESYEKDGHYFFKVWVQYGRLDVLGAKHGAVPFIFAIPQSDLETHNQAEEAVKKHLRIIDIERAIYAEIGCAPEGAPLWA